MGTAVRTAKTCPASWDAFADIDAFVDEVLVELAAMEADGTKPTRSGPKPALTGTALRKVIMVIWCLCFCGLQHRTALRYPVQYAVHPVFPRLGLWCRLLDRLRRTWRLACSDTAEPSAVVIDSPLSLSASGQLSGERSCRSAPSCFERGFDGGKKIKGIKIHLGVEKYGIPLAVDVSPANVHDTKGIVPVLREFAGQGFRGSALGDLGYRGKRLTKAGQTLGITVEAIARSRDGKFLPAGICWVVERSFAWLARYRRLNTIFERTKEHLVAFIEIAFVSILARRLKRLVSEEVSA
jgi:transposase